MSDYLVSQVWSILHARLGARNAIKGKELAERVGLRPDKTGERAIQKAIEQLRKRRKPIAAGSDGYWVPITLEERTAYKRWLDSRIETMRVARNLAVKAMGFEAEQMPLFGPDGRRSA